MGKFGFPKARREIEHLARRVLADALQDINQVGVGVDPLQPAGHQQALDQADALGADLGPGEEPVLFVMATLSQ
jgi:hypothetical protein